MNTSLIYGASNTLLSTPFAIDKVYSNRTQLDAAEDQILLGRYVLIRYCDEPLDWETRELLHQIDNDDSEIIYEELDDNLKQYVDNYRIDRSSYPNIIHPDLKLMSYDSTVWRKVYINNAFKYEAVANLATSPGTTVEEVDNMINARVSFWFEDDNNTARIQQWINEVIDDDVITWFNNNLSIIQQYTASKVNSIIQPELTQWMRNNTAYMLSLVNTWLVDQNRAQQIIVAWLDDNHAKQIIDYWLISNNNANSIIANWLQNNQNIWLSSNLVKTVLNTGINNWLDTNYTQYNSIVTKWLTDNINMLAKSWVEPWLETNAIETVNEKINDWTATEAGEMVHDWTATEASRVVQDWCQENVSTILLGDEHKVLLQTYGYPTLQGIDNTEKTTLTLKANVEYYLQNTVNELEIQLEPLVNSDIPGNYYLEFTTGDARPRVSIPDTAYYAIVEPIYESNTAYTFSIKEKRIANRSTHYYEIAWSATPLNQI